MMLDLVEHALVALAIQAMIGLATRNWWAGAALASGYFIGREVAQAEYRWIALYGQGLRANLPWWGAFDARLWQSTAQVADWLGPLLATGAAALFAQRRKDGAG